ncbi:helix-turn-helix transcriptional regulator [Actinoallomurus rhizosphaericola]|uniref:helix-turn-helix transcriptional regulator n=1 Tax=Actinoallomurus rhizosphaericola TaxID=2952536 RepID=UPI002093EF4D|nr:AAA family ATPase [Actinoallomurus rhizosphaericola]MCO5995316.1 LuxR family transcriptional regulator [Actinoallomurus rhizosphaericola]
MSPLPTCDDPGNGPIVGRDRELARCQELLSAVGPGGQAVLIEGEAGIGKSTLVDAVVRLAAAQGFRELRCTGVQSETTYGFAGLHELFHPVLDRLSALPDRQRQALEVALGQADGPAPSRLMTGLAALGLLEDYSAEQPAVVVVEDAQWLDASTAQAIAFVARRLSNARVLLIVTMRTDAAERAIEAPEGAAAGLIRSIPLAELPLGPLTEEESERLLREQRPEPDEGTRRLILAEAVGNPLALTELGRALTGHPPPGGVVGDRWLPMTRRLQQAFLAGASRLPERSRRMLLLIAAAPESSLRQLMTAAARAGLSLDDLAPIEKARLATVAGDQVVLRHPLVRSAVYGAASFAERTAAHRVLADTATDPDRAAWHAAAAVPDHDDAVAAALEATATRARDRSALAESVAALRRAAALSSSEPDRTRRLAAAAEIARQAGDVAGSALLVREARSAATDPDVLAHLALTQVALTNSAAVPGHSTDDLLDLAARLAGPRGDGNRTQRLRVLATAATAHCVHGLPDDLRARLRQAIDAAAGDDGGLLALVGRVLLYPAEHAAQARSELPGLLRVIRDAYLSDEARRWPSRPQIIIGAGLMAEAVHDLPAALDCWNLGVEYSHRTGAPGDEAWALRERGMIRIGLGRLQDGLADAEMALRIGADLGLRVTAADAAIAAARAYAWRGDNARALAALDRGEELAGADGPTFIKARASWAAGLVALNERRHEDAWAALNAAQAHTFTGWWALADLTEAAVRTGRTAQVTPLLTRASEEAAAFASPYLDNLVRRGLAQVQPGSGAEEHFEAALATAGDNPSTLEIARTRLVYGEWLRRRRRIVDAREQLGAALRVFEGAGASPWAERAAAELRAAGVVSAPPTATREAGRRAVPDATAVLTAQELQIARMAAAGMTNREIADRIYLSHRTVATHLYKVFPKLGVSNRTQLRAALEQAGAA